jgi:hypothetical protein
MSMPAKILVVDNHRFQRVAAPQNTLPGKERSLNPYGKHHHLLSKAATWPSCFALYFIVCLIERILTFESGKMVFMFGA